MHCEQPSLVAFSPAKPAKMGSSTLAHLPHWGSRKGVGLARHCVADCGVSRGCAWDVPVPTYSLPYPRVLCMVHYPRTCCSHSRMPSANGSTAAYGVHIFLLRRRGRLGMYPSGLSSQVRVRERVVFGAVTIALNICKFSHDVMISSFIE